MRHPPYEDAAVELTRDKLCRRLEGVLANSVTVLRAPPGYGKSTAIRQSAPHWRAAGASVSVVDRGSLTIAEKIAAAVQATPPGSPGVLVIDQLHEIAEPQWAPAVVATLKTIPPHLHLVLATRRALPPSVLDACQTVAHDLLGSALFSFDRQECLQILRERSSLERAEALCGELHQLTGGWPVAVAAAARGGKLAGRSWEQYLRAEVLAAQPAELREFLRGSVLLGTINYELCDAVLGRRDSRAAIEELTAQELMSPLPGAPAWFRHHPLVAETLRDLTHRDERVMSRVVHRRAAHWHAERQDRHRAVVHLLALGDYGAAAEVVLGAPPPRPVADLPGLLAVAGQTQPSVAADRETGPIPPTLSSRERQVLERLAAGLANKEIACELFISVATVKAHVYRIFRKLQVNNRTAAVAQARRRGFTR